MSGGPFADLAEKPAGEGGDAFAYAETLAAVGARHCIFTLTHAKQYLPFPLAELDRILPGRTAGRDLVGDLVRELHARGIRFIAYYNHSCNGNDDVEWKRACGYAAGVAGNLDRFAEPLTAFGKCEVFHGICF